MNRLAAEVGVHWRTVKRWSDGHKASAATEWALRRACAELGIRPPPEPKEPEEPISGEQAAS